jgi:predicted secreted Zn-dependent protease
VSERKTPSTWRKSSFSQGGDCVEWSCSESLVCVRTSKDPEGRVLTFTHHEWRAFIAGVKSGEADLGSGE